MTLECFVVLFKTSCQDWYCLVYSQCIFLQKHFW